MAKNSKYEALNIADRLESITGWAKEGITDDELGKQLGVSRQTISAWKGKYPAFAEALKKGAEVANGEILCSAFRQACGFFMTVKEPIKVRVERFDEKTGRILKEERVEIHEYQKYFEPNPRITQFMLMNRLPNKYKNKPVGDDDTQTIIEHFVPDGDMDGENSKN